MVLYGISYGRESGFCMDLYEFAIRFGECHIGPYEPPGLYGSVWNFLQKRIWFLYAFAIRFAEFGSVCSCMEYPTEKDLVSVWIWGIRVCMVLYGISCGRGSGFCMDLQFILGNAVLDHTNPRVCMVLYGIYYRRESGFCMDLYGFGEFGSVWFCMEFPAEEDLVSVWICMDLQFVLGKAILDHTNPRVCMVLYGISYRRESGFYMDLYGFGEFESVWFCMECRTEKDLVSV